MKSEVVLAAAVFAALLAIGEAVNCYQCDVDDWLCQDTFDSEANKSPFVQCSYCYKKKYTYKGCQMVERGCARPSQDVLDKLGQNGCMQTDSTISGSKSSVIDCYCFENDGCNGAASFGASLVVGLVAAVTSLLFQ